MSSVAPYPFSMTALKRNVMISSRLQSTGVSADIDLPQICVLGSQSAGKSSLIEAFSAIALPRASGTCTRCPTECIMTNSDEPWRCDVFLRFKYDSKNQPLIGGQMPDIPFGDTLYTREDVRDRVRRAQLAILNPKLNKPDFHHSFLTSEPPLRSEMTFSPNIVVLKVSGPDIVDLSFVDLPGIIATAVNGVNEDDIKAVRDLACHYVKNPNAIVLLTVTCETDPDNQGAYEIVKEHDPDGSRTIGVATKPDRIENGQEDRWLRLLNNNVMHLQNGWYCVKLPGPEQALRGISWQEASRHESAFFKNEPWTSRIEFAHQLGTPKLVEKLSTLLSNQISKTLPGLLAKINAKIDEIRAEIGKFPSAIDNPARAVTQLIVNFQRKVDLEIAGTTAADGLVQKIKAHANVFRGQLRGTAPRFVPFKPDTDKTLRQDVPSILFLPEEERDLGNEGTYPVQYITDVEKRATDATSRELPRNVPFALKKEMIQESIQLWREYADVLLAKADNTAANHFSALCKQHFEDFAELRNLILAQLTLHQSICGKLARDRVNWILEMENHATCSLNAENYLAYRHKLEAFYKGLRWRWGRESNIVRRPSTIKVVQEMPQTPKYQSPLIPIPAGDVVSTGDCIVRADEAATEISSDSPYRPPLGGHYARLAEPHSVPSGPVRLRAETDTEKRERLIKQLESNDFTELFKLIPATSDDHAIEIMADVRAYWQVAFKRCVDYILLAIDIECVRGFGKDLSGLLFQELGLLGPDADKRCCGYLAQRADIISKQSVLRNQLRRLERAKDVIEEWRTIGFPSLPVGNERPFALEASMV